MAKQGVFLVIDGTDGSGKGTQTALAIERLTTEGQRVKMVDFPQYGNGSAFFVEKYLRGEYGSLDEVGPYKASLFYALDRFDKAAEIRGWLAEGQVVIANRYVSSNIGHQAGKIADPIERQKFLAWLLDLEFGMLNIPQPDAVIILFMPPAVGQKLVDQKSAREYTQGKKRDIHEADLQHLEKASQAYLEVAKQYGWTVIDCADGDVPKTIPVIHEQVSAVIKKLIG